MPRTGRRHSTSHHRDTEHAEHGMRTTGRTASRGQRKEHFSPRRHRGHGGWQQNDLDRAEGKRGSTSHHGDTEHAKTAKALTTETRSTQSTAEETPGQGRGTTWARPLICCYSNTVGCLCAVVCALGDLCGSGLWSCVFLCAPLRSLRALRFSAVLRRSVVQGTLTAGSEGSIQRSEQVWSGRRARVRYTAVGAR